MDKEADTVSAFGQVGFGFVEVGTLTPRPQPGNDKPRLFRLIPQRAIINRMGFNNHGIAAGVENIREATRFNGVLGVNIGKNKVTPNEDAAQDYLACLRAAWPWRTTLPLTSPPPIRRVCATSRRLSPPRACWLP